MINAFITNLGKYNEGKLCGEWLKLPAEKSDVQALLARIGVDGVLYEETFITDYETSVDGLCKYLGEYESVDELNYLADLISNLEEWELEKFEVAVYHGDYNSCVKDLINLTQNLDCYEYLPDINNEEELGVYYIDEMGALTIPEHLKDYFDYEKYGDEVYNDGDGAFIKGGGYVETNRSKFEEYYTGRADLPDEHKIFAYPNPPSQMPVKQQLEMYAKMMTAPAADKQTRARDER